jgi:hypothetical protein
MPRHTVWRSQTPDVIPLVNPFVEQMVLVSPKLALVHTQRSAEEWVETLTTMHHANPTMAATHLTWRRPHKRPTIFAAPDLLQVRTVAERQQAFMRENRPSRMALYRQDLVTVEVRGSLGPDPDFLLAALVGQMKEVLGRDVPHGKDENDLEPSQHWSHRDATGAWTGKVIVHLPNLPEARAVYQTFQGGTVQVGNMIATLWVRHTQLDANPALLTSSQGNAQGGDQ